MTTDLKELLELAAKACGYEVLDLANSGFYIKHADGQLSTAVWWAPHLDDGDNSRMEGKLHLSPDWYRTYVFSRRDTSSKVFAPPEKYADHAGDKQAARRWASLRAAASIGEQMP